jgi:hypothetical protein
MRARIVIAREQAARIRALDGHARSFVEQDRNRIGLPAIDDCEFCKTGLAEKICTDDAPDSGPSWEFVNGSAEIDELPACADCAQLAVMA